MALWTIIPDGRRVLVVLAHCAYAAAMTEDAPPPGEESEQLKVALREMDAGMEHAVHCGLVRSLLRVDLVEVHCADEQESIASCDD